jgi:hypothetical protein
VYLMIAATVAGIWTYGTLGRVLTPEQNCISGPER